MRMTEVDDCASKPVENRCDEIIRCEECFYCELQGASRKFHYCMKLNREVKEKDYCAWAKRK